MTLAFKEIMMSALQEIILLALLWMIMLTGATPAAN